ncbi:hypothetical protein N1028_08050 [Herbiconiux sp. CPCC 203407]|uniref:Uncharacterized protein n=1 Tax=Herbiconiux oxytropis TaxID=2970915 RepID=A0AA41XG54_9MICO|nr:hypothetical protein [Herbiconiux oxytropis]MCS5722892.1 hypothetical protein [Herbiconiux oxytropis]MCS5725848.1 hypothetical protein [Herbiconiux oxytropis]
MSTDDQVPSSPRSYELRDLLAVYRDSLIALGPIVERAGLSWHDEDAHDGWEAIAEALFSNVVTNAVSADPRFAKALPFPKFDFDVDDYPGNSWIELEQADASRRMIFVRLFSEVDPYDAAVFADAEAGTLHRRTSVVVPWREAQRVLVRGRFSRDPDVLADRIWPVE